MMEEIDEKQKNPNLLLNIKYRLYKIAEMSVDAVDVMDEFNRIQVEANETKFVNWMEGQSIDQVELQEAALKAAKEKAKKDKIVDFLDVYFESTFKARLNIELDSQVQSGGVSRSESETSIEMHENDHKLEKKLAGKIAKSKAYKDLKRANDRDQKVDERFFDFYKDLCAAVLRIAVIGKSNDQQTKELIDLVRTLDGNNDGITPFDIYNDFNSKNHDIRDKILDVFKERPEHAVNRPYFLDGSLKDDPSRHYLSLATSVNYFVIDILMFVLLAELHLSEQIGNAYALIPPIVAFISSQMFRVLDSNLVGEDKSDRFSNGTNHEYHTKTPGLHIKEGRLLTGASIRDYFRDKEVIDAINKILPHFTSLTEEVSEAEMQEYVESFELRLHDVAYETNPPSFNADSIKRMFPQKEKIKNDDVMTLNDLIGDSANDNQRISRRKTGDIQSDIEVQKRTFKKGQ